MASSHVFLQLFLGADFDRRTFSQCNPGYQL